MSLVKTLAKVAIGVVMAKGVSQVAKGGSKSAGQAGGTRQGGLDDLVGQLGGMLGGRKVSGRAGGSGAGGLGSVIESLAKAGSSRSTRRNSAPSGLEGLLGAGGMLGGILAGASARGSSGAGGLGGMLDTLFQGQEPPEPTCEQELAAALMLRAMIQAVKADGEMDAQEKARLMAALGDATEAEVAFVNAELAAPLDLEGLVSQVPQGMEAQVYAVSLSAIDLDHRAEAEYLHRLAQALGLEPAEVNAIHDQMAAPKIFG